MKQPRIGRPDYLLLITTIILVSIGVVMIFSASSTVVAVRYGNAWHYAAKQSLFAGVGLLLMLVCMCIPYRIWKPFAPHLLLISFVLLLWVLIGGNLVNGARRWISIGFFQFQPTEFAKLSLIIYLAALISNKGERIASFKRGLLPILIVVGLLLMLIMRQPDFGSSMLLIIIALAIVISGGIHLRQLAIVSAALIPVMTMLAFSKSYRVKRLVAFLNPLEDASGSGYQLIQSFYALAHGGLFGTGLGHGVQKHFYLPEAHTDFIFAVVGEEFGFLGALFVILLFLLYLGCGLRTALRSNDPFAILLATGIITMIGAQILLNLGAVTGALPVKGMPLPFISYGGSSLLLCMVSTGILLSISRDNHRRCAAEAHPNARKQRV
ncbi:putative lipid II flippase FtsW [Paenibacillus sp. 1001270B_150601_E10]|uniref:putative lipid II flippase FtsW n=1 Tax=Paenibacillus sp. 1001270B_150601_E10 TaxID=2787079 RepID=UPI00189CE02E|nr:putative lipid II flippase FtsW [Paenibacillus sp. 1001270B_150601_E10]